MRGCRRSPHVCEHDQEAVSVSLRQRKGSDGCGRTLESLRSRMQRKDSQQHRSNVFPRGECELTICFAMSVEATISLNSSKLSLPSPSWSASIMAVDTRRASALVRRTTGHSAAPAWVAKGRRGRLTLVDDLLQLLVLRVQSQVSFGSHRSDAKRNAPSGCCRPSS